MKCFIIGSLPAEIHDNRGRTVIAEALEMTSEVADALVHDATAEELRTIALTQGMIPFAAEGIRQAACGESTVDEVLRFAAFC